MNSIMRFGVLLLIILVVGCSPSSKSNANEADSLASVMDSTLNEDLAYEPDAPVTVPEFTEEQMTFIEYMGEDKWISRGEDGEPGDSYWSLYKDNDGYYRPSGNVLGEDIYLESIEQLGEENSYFITFTDDDSPVGDCFSIEILSEVSFAADYFDQCARSSGSETIYTRNGVEDTEAGPVRQKVMLQWKEVSNYQGSLVFIFTDKDGEEIGFDFIEIEGFDRSDNPYFTEEESDESMFYVYNIKEEIKDDWYLITYIKDEREIDLAGIEMARIIIDIENITD